jgi:hypothetical protein
MNVLANGAIAAISSGQLGDLHRTASAAFLISALWLRWHRILSLTPADSTSSTRTRSAIGRASFRKEFDRILPAVAMRTSTIFVHIAPQQLPALTKAVVICHPNGATR